MASILMVDDEEDLLTTVGVLLKHEGHHITAVSSGLEAIELLRSLEKFDLLVTDLRMVPVSGMEVAEFARNERPELAVIILSAYMDLETSKILMDMGCRACVRKPFGLSDILDPILECLAEAG